MAGRASTREDDEQLLDWIEQRRKGRKAGEIGKSGTVYMSTNRVRDDDMAHHDPKHSADDVARAYW